MPKELPGQCKFLPSVKRAEGGAVGPSTAPSRGPPPSFPDALLPCSAGLHGGYLLTRHGGLPSQTSGQAGTQGVSGRARPHVPSGFSSGPGLLRHRQQRVHPDLREVPRGKVLGQ